METQSYDVSRIFADDTGPCPDKACPKCACPTGKVAGDTWYHEYQSSYLKRDNNAKCVLCECKEDANDNLYSYCPDRSGLEDTYTVGTKSCPPPETYQCHESRWTNSGILYHML